MKNNYIIKLCAAITCILCKPFPAADAGPINNFPDLNFLSSVDYKKYLTSEPTRDGRYYASFQTGNAGGCKLNSSGAAICSLKSQPASPSTKSTPHSCLIQGAIVRIIPDGGPATELPTQTNTSCKPLYKKPWPATTTQGIQTHPQQNHLRSSHA